MSGCYAVHFYSTENPCRLSDERLPGENRRRPCWSHPSVWPWLDWHREMQLASLDLCATYYSRIGAPTDKACIDFPQCICLIRNLRRLTWRGRIRCLHSSIRDRPVHRLDDPNRRQVQVFLLCLYLCKIENGKNRSLFTFGWIKKQLKRWTKQWSRCSYWIYWKRKNTHWNFTLCCFCLGWLLLLSV